MSPTLQDAVCCETAFQPKNRLKWPGNRPETAWPATRHRRVRPCPPSSPARLLQASQASDFGATKVFRTQTHTSICIPEAMSKFARLPKIQAVDLAGGFSQVGPAWVPSCTGCFAGGPGVFRCTRYRLPLQAPTLQFRPESAQEHRRYEHWSVVAYSYL